MEINVLSSESKSDTSSVNKMPGQTEYKNVGYFFQANGDIGKIDVSSITHLNYSFGLIHHNEENNEQGVPVGPLFTIYLSDGVKADLERISELKKQNSSLKVLLSVGGWGCRGFSDSAATKETREIFAASCKDVIDAYGLDGIDLDWEYPVSGGGGVIKSVPQDKLNFTLLLQAVRDKIGENKLLTIATAAIDQYTTEWTEIIKVSELVDFINIMTYDMEQGTQYHHAPLHPSREFPSINQAQECSIDSSVNCCLKAGIPGKKLNLGIPFYGRAPRMLFLSGMSINESAHTTLSHFEEGELPKSSDGEYAYTYRELVDKFIDKNGFEKKWDNDAKLPYLLYKGKFAISYEDDKSIECKTNYLKEKDLGGAMFWEYSCDWNNVLANKIAVELGIK